MMNYILFFISLLFCAKISAQESNLYNLICIDNKIIDKGAYIADEKTSEKAENRKEKLVYIMNSKKDSVVFYNFYNSKINSETVPTLYSLLKKGNVLILNVKRDSEKSSLLIKFDRSERYIVVGDNNIFHVSKDYFDHLYHTAFSKQNLPDLIDFLSDFLEDYNLSDLKYIASNEKYKHSDFKILKAHLESYRSQASDYLDTWNVHFSYNKKGVLNYLKKESKEGDLALEKKLLSCKKGTFKYTKYQNQESRLITNSEINFDTSNRLFNEKITSFQSGLGKESRSIIQRTSYKVIPFDHLFLNSKNIIQVSKITNSKTLLPEQ